MTKIPLEAAEAAAHAAVAEGVAREGTVPTGARRRAGGRECDPPADRASLMGVGDMPVLWG
eukprot:CAMPEP_0171021874 /NCGR_PEP_ID=MMETSP0736-20130129/30976_1 /TAXON_ID=186038 /ORGANISM="Fragilariopsis kerguelensis, Strain L26-C5" /LENGTH=60 /DNA_ID=CAMNT_0011460361 /DNA_START=277 /DNA_END=455 /DNA_ORIENTATION=-